MTRLNRKKNTIYININVVGQYYTDIFRLKLQSHILSRNL